MDKEIGISSQKLGRRRFLKVATSLALAAAIGLVGRFGAPVASASSPGISGRVLDLGRRRPLAGIRVESIPGSVSAFTDASGKFTLPLTPGVYDIRVAPAGYVGTTLRDCLVSEGETLPVDIGMQGLNPTPHEDRAIYESVVDLPVQTISVEDSRPDSDSLLPQMQAAAVVPETITVLIVRDDNGNVLEVPEKRTMLFEEYLRGVVPNEMPASWPMEALKAQAVAARTYAAYQVLHSKHAAQGAHVCNWTCCQVWTNQNYDRTDQAVNETRGVIATYGGNVINAFFFGACDGQSTRDSEQAIDWSSSDCGLHGWNYVAYCRARPCTGHDPCGLYSGACNCGFFGHGVGMCQYGARDKAASGRGYLDIINDYYTGIAFVGVPSSPSPPQLLSPADGTLALAGNAQTFKWTRAGDQHWLEVKSSDVKGFFSPGWISGTQWSTGMPSTQGKCFWRVKAMSGGQETPWSETRTLILTDVIHKQYLPLVQKNAL